MLYFGLCNSLLHIFGFWPAAETTVFVWANLLSVWMSAVPSLLPTWWTRGGNHRDMAAKQEDPPARRVFPWADRTASLWRSPSWLDEAGTDARTFLCSFHSRSRREERRGLLTSHSRGIITVGIQGQLYNFTRKISLTAYIWIHHWVGNLNRACSMILWHFIGEAMNQASDKITGRLLDNENSEFWVVRSRPWSHHKIHLLATPEHMIFITSSRTEFVWLSWTCRRTNSIFFRNTLKSCLDAILCFYIPVVFLLSSPSSGERSSALLLWSSRNITRTTKLQPAFPSARAWVNTDLFEIFHWGFLYSIGLKAEVQSSSLTLEEAVEGNNLNNLSVLELLIHIKGALCYVTAIRSRCSSLLLNTSLVPPWDSVVLRTSFV